MPRRWYWPLGETRAEVRAVILDALKTHLSMRDSINHFGQVCDREIATIAAFRSMGVDPNGAPQYEWPVVLRPEMNVGNVTNIGGHSSWWKAALAIIATILLIAALFVAAYLLWPRSRDLILEQQQPDGGWKQLDRQTIK